MSNIKIIYGRYLSVLPYLVFAVSVFIFFGFFGDYILFYQEKSSLFVFSFEFLSENLQQPGGLIIYLGKLLSSFFYYPIAGAMVISGTLTVIVFLISRIITAHTEKYAVAIHFIIGVILFFLQTNYHFLLFNNLGLLLQLAFFYLAIRHLTWLKGWIPVLVIPLWYFITGGFSFVFSIMLTFYCAFWEVKKGRYKIAVIWLLNLFTFQISKELLFFQTEKILLTFPFTDQSTGSQSLIFLSITGVCSILPAILRLKIKRLSRIKVPNIIINILNPAIIVIALALISLKKYDLKTRQYFQVEKLFYQNKFDELIAYNMANPSTNSLTVYLNNIALCEKSLLNDQLFYSMQSPDGKTLFLKWEMLGEVLKRGGYFYYTIGMANEAHRWAYENMVMKGYSPEGIKMLIKTDLINGNYEVATKYIKILKKTLFYKSDAIAYEKLLNDTAVNADPELGEKRKNRLKFDFFTISEDPYINIERILAYDSLNRNAFQYKLAFMMLRKYYQGIATELPKLRDFGFAKIPLHIEEAAVALSILDNSQIKIDPNLQLSSGTLLRWTQFLSVFQQYGTDLKRAEPALRRQFGNTFWYYAFYR